MKKRALSELTDEQLIQQRDRLGTSKTMDAVLIGIFVGIAIFSLVAKGLSFWTAFPLFFAWLFLRKGQKMKAILKEMEARNIA